MNACGGGTSNNPDPVIDPVEVITQADLAAAGVPNLPTDNSSSSIDNWDLARNSGFVHHSSIQGTGFVDDGAGNLVLNPDNLPARRVVGWAWFEAQADEVDQTIPVSMQITGSGFSGFRVFYAVGNYSTGKWEIGGRIVIDVLSAGFSLRNDYVSPQGKLYFLVIAGHPGSNNPPSQPVVINHEEVWWARPSMPFAGGELGIQTPATADVQMSYSAGGEVIAQLTMEHGDSAIDRDYVHLKYMPSFPAEFNLTSFKGTDEELQALWSSGVPRLFGAGAEQLGFLAYVESPVILYHNTNELNGRSYPFSLHAAVFGDANLDGYVNSLEIEQTATYGVLSGVLRDGTSNTFAVAPNIGMAILNEQEELLAQAVTDDKGRFSFNLNQAGNFILEYSRDYYPERIYGSARVIHDSKSNRNFLRVDFFENQAGWESVN